MKYYATLEAEPERSRIVKKGSNSQLVITLFKGNKEVGLITYGGGEVSVEVYGVSPHMARAGEVRFTLEKVIPIIKA